MLLTFEKGGIVPGVGGEAVPMVAHAREMVLSAHVSNWALNAAGAGPGRASSTTSSFHLHANVSTIDAAGAKEFFERNADRLGRIAFQRMRRRAV